MQYKIYLWRFVSRISNTTFAEPLFFLSDSRALLKRTRWEIATITVCWCWYKAQWFTAGWCAPFRFWNRLVIKSNFLLKAKIQNQIVSIEWPIWQIASLSGVQLRMPSNSADRTICSTHIWLLSLRNWQKLSIFRFRYLFLRPLICCTQKSQKITLKACASIYVYGRVCARVMLLNCWWFDEFPVENKYGNHKLMRVIPSFILSK